MKRTSVLLVLLLSVLLTMAAPASAAANAAALCGPEEIFAGDTLQLTLNVNGNNEYCIFGTLSYDPSQLELTDTQLLLESPWKIENGQNGQIIIYDDHMVAPIQSEVAVLKLTFLVKELEAGTRITVSLEEFYTSNENKDTTLGTVSYSARVGQSRSSNNKLRELTVDNAVLAPAFHPDTTAYTAQVPYDIHKLDVKAVPADETATVQITNPELIPGDTTDVTITVTAQNGDQRTYRISVQRDPEPEEQPEDSSESLWDRIFSYLRRLFEKYAGGYTP